MTVKIGGVFLNGCRGVRSWYLVVQRVCGVKAGFGPGTVTGDGGFPNVDSPSSVSGRG